MEMKTVDETFRAYSTYGTVWKIYPRILVRKPEAKEPIGRPRRK
jgi:hypothetical protein